MRRTRMAIVLAAVAVTGPAWGDDPGFLNDEAQTPATPPADRGDEPAVDVDPIEAERREAERGQDQTPGVQMEVQGGIVELPAEHFELLREADPSLRGLDRSHWPVVTFSAAGDPMSDSGGWLEGRRFPAGREVVAAQTPEERFDAALAGASPSNLNAADFVDLLAEPARLGRDILRTPSAWSDRGGARGGAAGGGSGAGGAAR